MSPSLLFGRIKQYGIHIYWFALNLYTSVFGCGCGFGYEQKSWRIDGFGEKKARTPGNGSADLHTPIYPPPKSRFCNRIPKLLCIL